MTASTNRQTTIHTHDCEPYGSIEIANHCGVVEQTVRAWKARGHLPPPDWTVGGRPLWCRHTVQQWARDSGRCPKKA